MLQLIEPINQAHVAQHTRAQRSRVSRKHARGPLLDSCWVDSATHMGIPGSSRQDAAVPGCMLLGRVRVCLWALADALAKTAAWGEILALSVRRTAMIAANIDGIFFRCISMFM